MEKQNEINKREEQIFLPFDKYIGKSFILISKRNQEKVFSKIYPHAFNKNALKEIIINERLAESQTEKIVKYYGCEKTNDGLMLNFEFCTKGSFYDCFKDFDFSNNIYLLKNLIVQIILGLKYIHKKGVIHNDIKAENILVFEKNKIKICDFGNSFLFDGKEIFDLFQESDDFILTPSSHRSFEWDYVCLGVMIYEMYLKRNFGHYGNTQILRSKIQSRTYLISLKSVPIKLKDFIVSLITNKLNDRNIFSHQFLRTKCLKKIKNIKFKNEEEND
jgi:serine/threonine protein kinase